MTASPLHRVGQFWRHASARVSAEELANAERLLGPQLAGFFLSLPLNDQRHGLDVLATMRRLEGDPGELLQQAALLHDMGKGLVTFSIIERSFTVLIKALSPSALTALLRTRPGLQLRYRTYADHAAVGARLLEAAGAPELAAIVAEHHDPQPRLDLTRRLQRADARH
jgi:hypothetical protein